MNDADLEALVARIALGDRTAFRRLYRLTAPRLFAVCVRILQDRAEAEAALQDAFLKIWRYAERQPACGAGALVWLVAIARNRAIERLRRRPAGAVLSAAEAVAAAAARDDGRAMKVRDGPLLADCLAALGERDRALVRVAWFGGATWQGLADREGLPVETVRARLREILAKLRQCVAPMSRNDGVEAEAMEYVLALMDERERRLFELALLDDPDLAAVVWRWEERLAPLGTAVKPRPAPERVRRRVERSLFGGGAGDARRAARRAAAFWRGLAGLFATLALAAAAVAVVALVRPEAVRQPAPEWIAAIERTGGGTALARLRGDGTLVAGPFPGAGRAGSAELWLVPPDGSPVSVGLLRADGPTVLPLAGDEAPLVPGRTRLVVTREPEGGSPAGQPTGPTLGEGTLTRI